MLGTKRLMELAATAVLMAAGSALFPQVAQMFRGEPSEAGDIAGEWTATDGAEAEATEQASGWAFFAKLDLGRFGRYVALWAVLVLSELVKEAGRGGPRFDLMRVLSFASFREMMHELMAGEVQRPAPSTEVVEQEVEAEEEDPPLVPMTAAEIEAYEARKRAEEEAEADARAAAEYANQASARRAAARAAAAQRD